MVVFSMNEPARRAKRGLLALQDVQGVIRWLYEKSELLSEERVLQLLDCIKRIQTCLEVITE